MIKELTGKLEQLVGEKSTIDRQAQDVSYTNMTLIATHA